MIDTNEYMDDITNNYKKMNGTGTIPNILGMTVNWEKGGMRSQMAGIE